MNFFQAVASGFSNYVNFRTRAGRSEYWYWVLFVSIVALAALLLDLAIVRHRHGPLESIWHLATFLPGLGLAVRRLHDTDRSGWWMALQLIVIAIFVAILLLFPVSSVSLPIMMLLIVLGMFIVLIYWFCQPGTPGPNRYGRDPLGPAGQITPRPTV